MASATGRDANALRKLLAAVLPITELRALFEDGKTQSDFEVVYNFVHTKDKAGFYVLYGRSARCVVASAHVLILSGVGF